MNSGHNELQRLLSEAYALLTLRQTSARAPYLTFGPILLGLLAYALGYAHVAAGPAVGCISIGLASWTVVEYVLHRFSFHSTSASRWVKPFTTGLHLKHHDEPQAEKYIAAPMQLAVPVFALLMLLFRALGGDWATAALIGAGLSAGFMLYERVHYLSHCAKPLTRVGRYLKKHHMTHHFAEPQACFGVTSPLWDLACGTLPKRSRGRRAG